VARHRRDPIPPPIGTPEPPGRRGTIRGRLMRIIALPLVAVAVLLTVVVIGDTNAYRTASDTDRAVTLLLETGNLVHNLQQERGVVAALLGGDVSFAAEFDHARTLVDEERATVQGLAAGADSSVDAALRGLDGLADIRGKVSGGQIDRAAAIAYYTARIAAFNAIDVGIDRSPDETLRREVGSLQALDEMKEATALERAFLTGVYAAGGFKGDEYRSFVTVNAEHMAAMERFRRYATPDRVALLDAALDTGAAREAAFFKDRALAAVNAPFVVSPQSWWSAHTTILDDMRRAQVAVGNDISARARSLRTGATIRLAGLAVLAVLSAVAASVLLITAARSITRPLAVLAAEALAAATVRLPEAVARVQISSPEREPEPPPRVAIPPQSSSEVVAVAQAIDNAQATAFALATEQARLRRSTSESLANLGRRNQNLLRRQLGFITQLEREEADPSGLANLFELDHLATRMRRNAESLLVLVGESSPRTWSEPVAVADVIRAAISEVEDYRRVTLRRVDDAYVGGAFVSGVAHMIAELVENGLAFSPPDVDVEIQGRALGGRYLIGITDQGLGMEPAEMARANARLRGEESYLTAPTRFLGHYVVGHLARQMGIDVELTPSPVAGVTARVTVPDSLLVTPAAIAAGPATASGNGARAIAQSFSFLTPTGRASAAPTPASAQSRAGGQLPVAGHAPVPDLVGAGPASRVDPRSRGALATEVAHGRGERTRNGLLKRVPGPRRPVAAETTAPPPPEPGGAAAAAQVRDNLSALRAGISRGEGRNTGSAPVPPAAPALPTPPPSEPQYGVVWDQSRTTWQPEEERNSRAR
jgi:anti-sigma regulatory factor (Ser/Thr protein kinase)